jgi:predicted secreted protein
MTVTAAIVLFAIIWFVSLLVALPIGITTQEEAGDVTPGTPPSAPVDPKIGQKMFWVTVVTLALWIPLCAVITWGGLTVRDLDVWHRM